MPRLSRPEKRRIEMEKEKLERQRLERIHNLECEREKERLYQEQQDYYRQQREYYRQQQSNRANYHRAYDAYEAYDESDDEDSDEEMNDFFRFVFWSRRFFYRNRFSGSRSEKTSTEEGWKCKDFYKTLAVEKNASLEDVKKAYKEKALQNHPDRFPDATDEQKVFYEESFKSIGEAYSVLKDTHKREAYDKSYQFGREY